jgi:HD-GYP domain-containing protein (c-di-GMP phosphodiesterase class II)
MIKYKLPINIFDLVVSISRVVDIMSPVVGNHHMQVAYLAYKIAEEMDLPVEEKNELLIAGALHDIGAFSLKERMDLLEFEETKPGEHSMAGYLLLKNFKPFLPSANLIKFHHTRWEHGKGAAKAGEPVPRSSHIIHLADRVVVQISKEVGVLGQIHGICDAIKQASGEMFVPGHVDAFLSLAKQDYIWLELTSATLDNIVKRNFLNCAQALFVHDLLDFSKLICRLVDFKSKFTATHSRGVAATSVAIAKLSGFSRHERTLMEIAAYFHDLGKLAIPQEILEKQSKLTDNEWHVMRSHVYYTHQILEPFDALSTINSWGALHQERLNGKGYPFGYMGDELPLGARIMAVADVFTALTEDRPYRKGMGKKNSINALHLMAKDGELDKCLVDTVLSNFNEMDDLRKMAQEEAVLEYHTFGRSLKIL